MNNTQEHLEFMTETIQNHLQSDALVSALVSMSIKNFDKFSFSPKFFVTEKQLIAMGEEYYTCDWIHLLNTIK